VPAGYPDPGQRRPRAPALAGHPPLRSLSFAGYQAIGAEANRLSPSASEMYLVMRCPRTLLPASSSGGENVPTPPLPGDTVTMPPATPPLPGRPTSYSHSPDRSYSPAVASPASTRPQ